MPNATAFRRILCPVDFSPSSRDALRYAAELTRRASGALTVLFVNDPLLASAAAAAAYNVRKLDQETREELGRFVEKAIGEPHPELTVSTTLGHPVPQILKAARSVDADLIVMGTRGLTAPVKWFLGSTAERVLRKTTVPVLLIPGARRDRAATTSLTTWPGHRIVVPIDIDDAKRTDVSAALAMARVFEATPTFLYALQAASLPPYLAPDRERIERRRTEAARAALLRLTRSTPGHARALIGPPAETIIAAAERLKVGLIVMTLKRSPGLFGSRRGVVTYRLLSRTSIPVLALPS